MKAVTGNPTRGLIGATVGFFIGFAAVSLFGPTAKKFQQVMDLSPALVGLLVAAPSLSGSLLRIPFSAWVDTTGGRRPFLVLLWLSVVGMGGLTLVVTTLYPDHLSPMIYCVLLLLGVLCGCGIATFSVGISQVAYWFPQSRQGWALGTYAGLGNIAPGLFAMLLPFALSSWGLPGCYWAWFFLLLAGTLVYQFIGANAWYFQLTEQGVDAEEARRQARNMGQELFPAGSLIETLRVSAAVWKTWLLVALYFTTFGGFIALTAWFPTYWQSFHNAAPVVAGLLTAVYSILASVIRVVGGSLADRIGGDNTALLALCFMLAGALIMSLFSGYALCVLAAVLLGIGMGVNNAAVFKLVPQEVPDAVGGAAGWVGGLGAFGGFAIPPILGAAVNVAGDIGYARGFFVFVFLAALSIGLTLLLKRSRVAAVAVPAK